MLQNNFKKFKKTTFLALKMVENNHIMGQMFRKNLDFWGHLSTSQAENTIKSRLCEAEINSQTTSEQPHSNFQKSPEAGFLTLKIVKMTLSEGQNVT